MATAPHPGHTPGPDADPSAARLVVVRHGATAWSLAGRHTGRTDLPLEPEGRRQAEVVGRRLAGHRFAAVLVSPLARARQTCTLAGLGAEAEVCDDLAEWDYGRDEGRTTAEIRSERPGWQIFVDGPEGGETLEQVAARADRVVARVRREAGDVLAIAHGHLLRVVAARWLGRPPELAASLALWPATVGVLGWERETPAVLRWNDAAGDPLQPG